MNRAPPDWTTERPTSGKWWVAIHPSKRDTWAPTIAVWIGMFSAYISDAGGMKIELDDPLLIGAKWAPRTEPQDPFAGGEG